MVTEQLLLEQWRTLLPNQQQQVLDFVEFLHHRRIPPSAITPHPSPVPLSQRLRQIRSQIVASGAPLLTWEGVEQEKASRRGGYQEARVRQSR